MRESGFDELGTEARALRARLRDEYEVRSMLMPIGTVARVLGCAPCTLHARIRAGDFFLPYRRINKTSMVSVDDFIAWWCLPQEKGAGSAEVA